MVAAVIHVHLPRPALAAAVALALGGCGLQSGAGGGPARVMITHEFGSVAVASAVQHVVPAGESVMRLLERSWKVQTASGGRAVQAIAGAAANDRGLAWSFWVNGIAPAQGPARTAVHPGDHLWWDLHDSSAATAIPAVVGSYPEPFTTGIGGRRLPTVLACAADVRQACQAVTRALTRAGIKVADQALGTGSGSDSLAVVVGTASDLSGVIATELIAGGPSQSGVYAQFVGRGGRTLEIDDPQGQVVRTLGAGAGLIAATEQPSLNQPAWLITGTDVAGVDAAAAALAPGRLQNHLALAVVGHEDLPVPLDPSR